MAQSGLFGLKITPGEIIPLDIFSDVRITNIAFGEKITGYARSVVKVHRARWADSLDDMSDDSEEDDEDEEEDESAEEEVAAQVNGKKGAGPKVNGKEESEEDEEDEENAESDSEEGVDVDDDDEEIVEEDFVICSLYPEKTEQAIVDLEFSAEEEIAFSVTGENAVELLGYYIDSSDPYDEEPDSDELDSDDDEYDSDELAMFNAIEGGEDSDEEMDEGEARIQEILEKAAAKAGAKNDKKRVKADDSDEEIEATKESVEQLSKNQRKKLNKKLKTDVEEDKTEGKEKPKSKEVAKPAKGDKTKAQTAKADAPKKDVKEDSKKVKTSSGLVIEDKTIGTGPLAKAGQRVGMRYVGRLVNGKQFDANQKGKPFSFRLGKGEVIAGWDEGIKGMQVEGTRRLIVPPKLAYGTRGAPPDIPPNATLVFDVKLVEIK